jgi:uncharacterized protein (TIGR02118 family)
MTPTWFATFRQAEAASADDVASLTKVLSLTPGLTKALIYTPARAQDPYLDDGQPPALALQLYFADMAALHAAVSQHGHLQAVAAADALPSLRGASVTHQAMLARAFPVPDPQFRTPKGAPHCTYLVAYDGSADDPEAWVTHYTEHHTAIMARFPGIRAVEVATRVEWHDVLPWPRAHSMLRNKVVFDDPDALTAALNSPVRHEMRTDFARFPKFTGPVTHYPMATIRIEPARDSGTRPAPGQ